jgi:hypothetical protein
MRIVIRLTADGQCFLNQRRWPNGPGPPAPAGPFGKRSLPTRRGMDLFPKRSGGARPAAETQPPPRHTASSPRHRGLSIPLQAVTGASRGDSPPATHPSPGMARTAPRHHHAQLSTHRKTHPTRAGLPPAKPGVFVFLSKVEVPLPVLQSTQRPPLPPLTSKDSGAFLSLETARCISANIDMPLGKQTLLCE